MAGVEVIVVDKAVSTEDLGVVNRDIHLEVARLEAMLNTLVENKVESLKADREKEKILKQRITSTSTTASSTGRKHHHRGRHHHREKREPSPRREHREIVCCEHVQEAVIPGIVSDEEDDELVDEAFDFLAYQDQGDPDAVVCDCSCGCPTAYPDNQHGQIMNLPYDDYISITMDLPDLPDLPSDADPLHPLDTILDDEAEVLRRARRKRRRKRRKRRRRERLAAAAAAQVATTRRETRKVLDDDLPQRARWTIVATACLLLLMCLLLVGVTLRMAPIIDDMVRKENEELLNSLQRGESSNWNTTPTAAPAVAAIGAGK